MLLSLGAYFPEGFPPNLVRHPSLERTNLFVLLRRVLQFGGLACNM